MAVKLSFDALQVDCHHCIDLMPQVERLTPVIDPYEETLEEIKEILSRKKADYAFDDDTFSNFRFASDLLGVDGFGPMESILHLIGVKLARLAALRRNGRLNEPRNETVKDTYRDLAVYGVIMYALAREELK